MPIYEYRRPDGSTFEIVQSFSDDPLTHDPESGVPVRRVLHPPAVHFKGTGFYHTDYGTRKRQREAASSEQSSAASPSDGAAGSGDGAAGSGDGAAGSGDGAGKAKGDGAGKTNSDGASDGAKPKDAKTVPAQS
jgi:putative FmdB family regulatory protein